MKLLEGGGAATPLENNRGERLDTGTFYGWGGRADEEVMKVIGGGGERQCQWRTTGVTCRTLDL
jgi:hypothetical protein